MTDDEIIQTQIAAVHAHIDVMVATFDARILAVALLGRSAGLLNGLRQLGIVGEEALYRYLDDVETVILDDSRVKPTVAQTPFVGGKLN